MFSRYFDTADFKSDVIFMVLKLPLRWRPAAILDFQNKGKNVTLFPGIKLNVKNHFF